MLKKFSLGDMLIRLKLLTAEQLSQIKEKYFGGSDAEMNNQSIVKALLSERLVTKEQLVPVLEYLYGVSCLDLNNVEIDSTAVRLLSERVAVSHKLIPVSMRDGVVHVAMADPLDLVAQDDVRLITKMDVTVSFAFEDEIERVIYNNYTSSDTAERAAEEYEKELVTDDEALADAAGEEDVTRAPIVRLINSILEQAVRTRASDVHIEPREASVRVRLRVDGDLSEMMTIQKASLPAIVTRIKIMSALNIAEKRVPQDGRVAITILDRAIDLRISILPTVYGEKVVMRILDRSGIMGTMENLGFTDYNLGLFNKLIKVPEGIILLSGPTGSGKTTTLYTVLREFNKPSINVITVEDPVEYRLDGIQQVQVNNKAGLTFASGLRSILRQDPDVIMIGEIRDSETAQIAARAAITGHVVLSTIHTNDTVSTVTRLVDMGIEVYLVASSLVGVVAQRLVKRICTNCKTRRYATDEELAVLDESGEFTVYRGEGCNVCHGTGYLGRIAIHEVLVLDKELRSMVVRGDSHDVIKERAVQKGLRTLQQSCKELVGRGVTTVEELLRATYNVD